MKSFNDFLNEEAKLRGSKGLPEDFLSDTERKVQQELRVRMDEPAQMREHGPRIMQLIETGRRLTFEGLTPDQQKERAEELEELAKEVIYAEYSNILDNVDLDIRMVPFGEVANEMQDLENVPQQPEVQDMEEEEKEEKEEKDKKKSFLDNLFKKAPKKENFKDTEEFKERVDKAKLINNIIQGEAKNTKKILHSDLVKSGLERIFGERVAKEIFKVWDDTTKVADKLDWIIPIEHKADMMRNQMNGLVGAVEVKWPEAENNEGDESEDEETPSPRSAEDILKEIESGKDISDQEEEIGELFSSGNPVIVAMGVDFPMLLHETVKGIYELIAAAYLPSEDADPKEISKSKVVKSAVTSFEDEAEDFRYGPYIAGALRDFVNKCEGYDRYPNMREYVFGRIVLLDAKEFLSLMKGILEKTASAKKQVEEIISEIIDEIRQYEVDMLDEPDTSYGEEEDGFADPDKEEEDEIEKIIKKSTQKEERIEGDYSNMSKSDLQKLIDKSLDEGDFETLRKIQPFMKESLEWKIYESEIKKILR
jgi:thiol-disulfide isomerase/thioredoxin